MSRHSIPAPKVHLDRLSVSLEEPYVRDDQTRLFARYTGDVSVAKHPPVGNTGNLPPHPPPEKTKSGLMNRNVRKTEPSGAHSTSTEPFSSAMTSQEIIRNYEIRNTVLDDDTAVRNQITQELEDMKDDLSQELKGSELHPAERSDKLDKLYLSHMLLANRLALTKGKDMKALDNFREAEETGRDSEGYASYALGKALFQYYITRLYANPPHPVEEVKTLRDSAKLYFEKAAGKGHPGAMFTLRVEFNSPQPDRPDYFYYRNKHIIENWDANKDRANRRYKYTEVQYDAALKEIEKWCIENVFNPVPSRKNLSPYASKLAAIYIEQTRKHYNAAQRKKYPLKSRKIMRNLRCCVVTCLSKLKIDHGGRIALQAYHLNLTIGTKQPKDMLAVAATNGNPEARNILEKQRQTTAS